MRLIYLHLLALLWLSGCSDYWTQDMNWEPKTVMIERVSQGELLTICGDKTRTGCTQRFAATQVAVIYLGPEADNCTLRHEFRHVAGWNHDARPNYRADCG